jgi:exodeoxyribonuclease V alpha subunit
LKEGLVRLFPGDPSGEDIDKQEVAAFTALSRRFCVISGGPGTGKTATVAKILALLIELSDPAKLRIVLSSPTGKGAARLQEAIRRVKDDLSCQQHIKEAIPSDASTIHRLLGTIKGSSYFRYHAENPVSVDVIVVDEASMVDLALMSKLIQALPMEARILLLGDKDQLASVEAGAVLGDICDTGSTRAFSGPFCDDLERATGYKLHRDSKCEDQKGIGDCIVQLDKSYRFGSDSGIAAVSDLVNRGEGDIAVDLLMSGRHRDITWRALPSADAFSHAIRHRIMEGYGDYVRASDPEEGYRSFDHFRILCAIREGPFGVAALNALVEKILKEEKLIKPDGSWYAGQPLMITSNDYNLRLFNGDVGIVLEDPEGSHGLRAFFPTEEGAFRKFHPIRLPEHETVYAMTVHKSQGSEFDRVLLILPDRDFSILTRELIYTAVTRARKAVEIWMLCGMTERLVISGQS